MLAHTQISLQGQFKFDVYKSDGSLRYTSEYLKNFITSTGLSYPSTFAFADCFRFLSVGSGTGRNSVQQAVNNGWGTTGLQSGLAAYSYIGGKTCDNVSQYESESCNFLEEGSGIRLVRAWRVPSGTGGFPTAFNFNEFMVTPGRPYVVDPDNASSKACSCNESTTPNGLIGLDGSNIAQYYTNPKLCDADKAFARVVKSIPVSADDFLVVTYELGLNFYTGIQNVSLSIQNTSTTNWSGVLLAKANLVHHGMKLVDDGIHSYAGREQIPNFSFGGADYGESFVPLWGAPLEPSCDISHVQAYLTTDNIQFLVNRVSGGAWTADLPTPVSGSGVMSWHSKPSTEMANGFSSELISVRQNPANSFYPDNTDYTVAKTADDLDFDVSYVTASRSQHTPLEDAYTRHSRFRTGSYSFQFWGNNEVDFQGKPVRGFVMGYVDASQPSNVYPVFDLMFADRLTKYPYIDTAGSKYSLPAEDGVPATGYFYAENGGILTLSFRMSWSSPCATGVDGC